MLESAWLFVGFVAILSTGVAVLTNDDGIAIMAGVLGFVTWGIWTYGAFNVEMAEGTSYSMPSLAILGIALALVPGYIALTGPVEIVQRYNSGNPDDL